MRFTTRGWWLLFILGSILVVGLLGPAFFRVCQMVVTFRGMSANWGRYPAVPVIVLIALTLLVWYCWEWLAFAVRSRLALRQLVVERVVFDEQGPVRQLWAGRMFLVRIRIYLKGGLSLHHVAAAERLPFTVRHVSGHAWCQGPLDDQPLTIEYRLRCTGMGRVRFEGVHVQMSDLHGFFHRTHFISAPSEMRVLPVLSDDLGHPLMHKRINLLPPPGLHRLLRPGSGSELLDLRDYLPGDPPKTIAWKVSAKRERLITKEYESEVPVRCTLFVDTSNSVRLGLPGRNALARLAEIAAAVTQANTSMRDLTGLCLFDESSTRIVRPARTARHLAGLMNQLADTAGLPPTRGLADIENLMRLGISFMDETYPHMIDDAVNRTPFWLARFWPSWRHQSSSRPWSAWVLLVLGWAFATGLFLVFAIGEGVLIQLIQNELVPALNESLVDAQLPAVYLSEDIFNLIYLFTLVLMYLPFVRFIVDGIPTMVSFHRRRMARWRKKLSMMLAVRYALGPGAPAVLMEDNHQFSLFMQRFLGEHHVPYALPYYDEKGASPFASVPKVNVLARALLNAVSKGHDNELYVLMVDLFDLTSELEPLLAAVRVALARHHQVIVIAPWPPGEPEPTAATRGGTDPLDKLLAEFQTKRLDNPLQMRAFLERLQTQRLHRELDQLRQTFGRLGVPVICAESTRPVAWILERLERLRGVRSRR